MYMWRVVDSEGEVLDVLVQPRRDGAAALKLLRKLLKRQGFAPTVIVTDRLRSYGAALQVIGYSGHHEQGLRANKPGRKFAPAGAPTGAQDAGLQIGRFSPALRLRPRRRLQRLQRPATSPLSCHVPPLPFCRSLHLEQRDRYGLKAEERDPTASDLC